MYQCAVQIKRLSVLGSIWNLNPLSPKGFETDIVPNNKRLINTQLFV